ncbi:hypothetical protein NQ314_010915 [Rhamnusium bicolor]|uniref:UBA domain-containing protein n=1 Tax=Rhamnusium bicolor TaxID=1586634 RepID=A0AAV8XNU1_9CUCU|nr:hypothetical protein NQ314_010915 [Rhamnusium bicolor]
MAATSSSVPKISNNVNATITNTQNILPSDKFSEADIREITALGFSREQVIFELRRFNGDKTQATAALFAKSLTF